MLFCRPVILRGQNPCMFPAIPGHCYAPLPSTHKQNRSIMDEAFLLFSSAVPSCQSVGRPWSARPYKQPLFHYSYRCFNEEVDLTLLAHQPCKQPRYCHTTLILIVPPLAPSSFSHCSVLDLFLSLLSSSYNPSIDYHFLFPYFIQGL